MVWSMDALGFAGHGTILDLSLGGARIQLERSLPIPVGTAISLTSAQLPRAVPLAKVRWVHRTGTVTQCGIEFQRASLLWNGWLASQSASEPESEDAAPLAKRA